MRHVVSSKQMSRGQGCFPREMTRRCLGVGFLSVAISNVRRRKINVRPRQLTVQERRPLPVDRMRAVADDHRRGVGRQREAQNDERDDACGRPRHLGRCVQSHAGCRLHLTQNLSVQSSQSLGCPPPVEPNDGQNEPESCSVCGRRTRSRFPGT